MAVFEHFKTREAAGEAAADIIAKRLGEDLAVRHAASLAVCGGSSPQGCFEQLSRSPLDWAQVQVTLTDERDVPVEHRDSNEGLLRRLLLTRQASEASFIPVAETALRAMPLPFGAVLCGMGADGHFASIFPDAPNRDALLDLSNTHACEPVITVASPHPRRSLTLAWLLRSRIVLLLIFGEDKRTVITEGTALPVHHLLQQTITPVHILWAP